MLGKRWGRVYNRVKKSKGAEPGGRGNQHVVKDQNEPLPHSTADTLAEKYRTSSASIKRDGQYAEAAANEVVK